jgi:hypothetical protein
MTTPGTSQPIEMAASILAMQHILIAKGVCTLEEFTNANKKSQDLIKALASSVSEPNDGDKNIVSALIDTVEFLGGEAALRSFKNVFAEFQNEKSGGE